MLKRYKILSIVYGGSGAKYADEMNALITRRSAEERYPISTKIVMENILTGDLLTNITELFTQTEFCLTFLTADDCCITPKGEKVYRIRQNVIFELGMAIFRLGREKCILLADFDPRDAKIELPSDLKGLDIKFFNKQNKEKTFADVLDKVFQLSSDDDGTIPRYDALLDREDYFVNYEDLFSSCSHITSRDGSAYLRDVLKYWFEECQSFTHYEERCLYFLERIAFLPMFGRHSWVYDWLVKIEGLLSSYKQSDISYCGNKKLKFIRNLAFTVSNITKMKMKPGFEPTENDYEDLLNRFILESAESSGVKNPLALTVYYDYLGLLHMYLLDGDQENYHLKEAISCFKRVMDNYVDHTDMNLGIWSGFVGYNLARCYLKLHKATGDPESAKLAQKELIKASVIRKGWLSSVDFHTTIKSALSYEYFICKIEQISSMKLLDTSSDQAIIGEFKRLEGELESYMIRDEQLERLCFVQDIIEKRQQEINIEDALSEKLL